MRAKDVISLTQYGSCDLPSRCVAASTPLLQVLPLLLDTPDRRLTVTDNREVIGIIDESSMLTALGTFLSARDDSSEIVVECPPEMYSASSLAHAVEDVDAHLVDLISHPAENGKVRVTLRVRHTDPSAAVRSLERYGYTVTEASGDSYADARLSDERLSALQVYLNV
ncbi:MAG: hypothetical protein NC201_00465 [Prevotella sp.]|nr:hypothetical protein [Bacteroides sp.]MCM1365701.1 hypothetical protein [Prevotella sp.]MCM1436371.1 hypothetical protein [Prevotella sp.]